MQKWEYSQLDKGSFGRFTVSGLLEQSVNEQDPAKQMDNFVRQIARLGEEGWELVGAAGPSNTTLLFKRQIKYA